MYPQGRGASRIAAWVATIVLVAGGGTIGAVSPAAARSASGCTDHDAVTRVAGTDRYGTAAQLATCAFGDGPVDTVYLAVGSGFADALAGGPLAAAGDDPVLLVGPGRLPASTRVALASLAPSRVVALGGTGAVSAGVLRQAAAAAGGAATDRIAGSNRYATAASIADELPPTNVVFLAVGTDFPDTLAAGPATQQAPILLTGTHRLPQATRAALRKLNPNMIVTLGGDSAVSPEVQELAGRVAWEVAGTPEALRLWGHDRYGTALSVATRMFPRTPRDQSPPEDLVFRNQFNDPDFVYDSGTVYVAVGTDYPDAVAAASAAARDEAPLLLTRPDGLPDGVERWLRQLGSLERVVVLGGSSAVSPAVEQQLESLIH